MRKNILLLLCLLFACFQGYCQEFAVEIKMKPQENKDYNIEKDIKIQSLSAKYNCTLRQSYPGAKTPELLLFYTLTGAGNKEAIIKDYLSTGKFENEVIEFDSIYHLSCVNPVPINDPQSLQPYNWVLDLIEAPCAWTITKGSPNVLIGIVEEYFQITTNLDLQNKFDTLIGTLPAWSAHGTSVATIAAAETNNGYGVAGVGYNCKVAGHLVGNDNGGLHDAIWNLYQMGVPVINVSWSGTGFESRLLAVEEMTQNGTTLVLGAGNSPTSKFHRQIANIPGVIVVSSVDRHNMYGTSEVPDTNWHARNQWIDICAPGYKVMLNVNNGEGYEASGTSYAAPFVAGAIGLMLSVNPNLTPAQIEEIIKSTADPIADGNQYIGLLGAGRLNAYKAVLATCASLPQDYTDKVVNENTTFKSCDNLNVKNVTVTNGAKLELEAPGDIIINGEFEVVVGSQFEIKRD